MGRSNYIYNEKNFGLIKVNKVIRSGDDDAIEQLEKKLERLQKENESLKEANKILRKKNLSDKEKVKAILNIDNFPKRLAKRLGMYINENVKFSLHTPEMRRVKERIEYLKKVKSKGNQEITKNGIRFVDNVEKMRYQLFFDDIPSAELRAKLKKAGFRWSPSEGAWQGYRNFNTKKFIKELFK